jgi:transposase
MSRGKRRLEIAYPDAAGIDIGSASHFVAVPADRDEQPVREFASFTADLQALARWLKDCGIQIVAMESTGVYWIPLYELLESQGFTVHLVNARHVRNVSGRKSDVLDCQWLQQLMSYGLLSGAFRPKQQICALRALSRQQSMLVRYQRQHVQHMHKALSQMNLQLDNVISDVTGETGQKIIRAILAGERDPHKLAQLRGQRIRASQQQLAKSLQGTWRSEHLFALKQAVDLYDAYRQKLQECDEELTKALAQLSAHPLPASPVHTALSRGRKPKTDPHRQNAMIRACGVDLTRIPGISTGTALKVIAEVGTDLARFPSIKHFTSWLGLCPGTKISGGKVLSGASKRINNPLALALRMAAVALRKSPTGLGAYYRRLCARLDKAKAIRATAHKLARLIYILLTRGEQYFDQGEAYYEERHRERVIYHLNKKAAAMGFALTPMQSTSS